MGSVSLLLVLAQSSSAIAIPQGGTTSGAYAGLLGAALATGLLLALCVPAARRERWSLVALLALLLIGTQAVLLFCLTQILAAPPV